MLTSATTGTLLAGLSRSIARGGSDPESAAALLESFRPETPIQAMLAAQAIALHHAAMDCFGRAMEAEADDDSTITRLQRSAASLTRAFTATLRTLQRCQAEAVKEAESARQDPVQREPASRPPRLQPLQSVPPSPSAWPDAQQNPMQREPAGALEPMRRRDGGEDPIQREPNAQRPWEELTEAEQFAILYPDRVAAGARSHEDADLWLPRIAGSVNRPAR